MHTPPNLPSFLGGAEGDFGAVEIEFFPGPSHLYSHMRASAAEFGMGAWAARGPSQPHLEIPENEPGTFNVQCGRSATEPWLFHGIVRFVFMA